MTEFDYPRDLVPHPRFGSRSVPSGFDVPRALIRAVYCYDRPPVFPESAIPADISRQHFSVQPRPCYVDMMLQCHRCNRPFIFFAREQRFWYEDLGFWVDAQCIQCPECRRWRRRLRQAQQRCDQAGRTGDWADEELVALVRDAVILYEAGILRSERKLRQIKNLAESRIPGSNAAQQIAALVADLQAKRGNTA